MKFIILLVHVIPSPSTELKALRHVRSDKLLSRSRSQPSSVPGTPKNMKSSDLRQCRTETKNRRTSELANGEIPHLGPCSCVCASAKIGLVTSFLNLCQIVKT